jgi:hypothetical protein
VVRRPLTCQFYGTAFSPSAAEEQTGLRLTRKTEPGEIANSGRYKDQSVPYGAATLETDDQSSWAEKWNSLLGTLTENLETMRACGADDIVLDCASFNDAQCNFELSIAEIQQLSVLGIALTFSCYPKNK